jgi:predicted GNAT family N-acyltransferase
MIFIKKITASDTFSVRQPILRAGMPLDSCKFDNDNDSSTSHFGLFEDDNLKGVASLFKKNNPNFENETQFQLRGMAVLTECQKKGYGAQLIQAIEKEAKSQKNSLIWFNARVIAVPFYEKLGYATFGTAFEIDSIGTHYVMFKVIE